MIFYANVAMPLSYVSAHAPVIWSQPFKCTDEDGFDPEAASWNLLGDFAEDV
jgi:NAD-dependent oxidoreductase involved in siderophore biosynthesis